MFSFSNKLDSRALVLIEMCARLIKNQLNHELRRNMREHRTALEAPVRSVVLGRLNLVLASSEESFEFWNKVRFMFLFSKKKKKKKEKK